MANEKAFRLTSEEILNKRFEIEVRGYSIREVDAFLDLVMADYKNFFHIVANMEKTIQNMRLANINLTRQIQELQNEKILMQEQQKRLRESNYNPLEIIQRLATLEEKMNGPSSSASLTDGLRNTNKKITIKEPTESE